MPDEPDDGLVELDVDPDEPDDVPLVEVEVLPDDGWVEEDEDPDVDPADVLGGGVKIF